MGEGRESTWCGAFLVDDAPYSANLDFVSTNITALPTFNVYALAPATTAHVCTYACPGNEEICAEVSLDENGQIRFAVTACPNTIGPDQAQSLLRSCFRGPKPLGFRMRPGVYQRMRKMLSAGDAWIPRG
jgi:hypothetical protein